MVFGFVAFIVGYQSASAQQVDPAQTLPETQMPFLDEALKTALQQSPQMIIRSLEITKAQAGVTMGDKALYPILGASAKYAATRQSTTDSPATTSNGFQYNIGVSYALYHWGEISNSSLVNRIGVEIAKKNYAQGYRDVVQLVRSQFLQLVMKKRAFELKRMQWERQKKRLEIDRLKAKQGSISQGDVSGSEVAFEESSIALDQIRLDYEEAKDGFMRICGRSTLEDAEIPNAIPEPKLTEKQQALMLEHFDKAALGENVPSISLSKAYLKQADLRYRVERVRNWPKLDLALGNSLQNYTNFSGSSVRQTATKESSAGVVINWDIFDGFYTRGAKLNALTQKRIAEYQLADAKVELDRKKKSCAEQFELSVRRLALREKLLGYSRGGFGYVKEELAAGRSSPEQVEQAQMDLFDAELKTMAVRAEVYARWSEFVSVLWMDPALNRIPASYLKNGK